MRRVIGILLTAAGASLLAFVGTSYAASAVARDRVRSSWEAAEARTRIDAALAALDESRPEFLAYGSPVARLVIPSAGLDEVVVEGVGSPELLAAPGHLPGSALPGEAGNSVVSAHRDRHFKRLARVQTGDTLITETRRLRAKWVVVSKRVVAAGEPALFRTDRPTLTLTTCWPLRYLGSAPDRLLVTAVLAE